MRFDYKLHTTEHFYYILPVPGLIYETKAKVYNLNAVMKAAAKGLRINPKLEYWCRVALVLSFYKYTLYLSLIWKPKAIKRMDEPVKITKNGKSLR